MTARNMITCIYTSDEGKSYLKRMDGRYQVQNDGGSPPNLLLGATPATRTQLSTLGNSPHDLKPRHALVATSDGAFNARLPVFTVAAYNALVAGTTAITFYDGQGASHAGVVVGKEGERSRHKLDIT